MRGDRVAFVGPNGVGKTTLLKMLTGEVAPDTGDVALGTELEIAVFDQARAALDLSTTLWDSLTNDPEMAVSGTVGSGDGAGRAPQHVVGYLKDFLFDEAQARAPIGSLSGGEKARLLLARIMAKPSNLLVLDEPTNDLDVETLDLLQDILGDYDGTVLLVSHDRDFIDRVATTTIAMEGDGRAVDYAGGWSDYQAQKGASAPALEKAVKSAPKPVATPDVKIKKPAQGLSFTEKHRLETLPDTIEKLEAEIGKLSDFLSNPALFQTAPDKFRRASEGLAERQAALAAAEEEWLMLEEKAGT